MKIKLVKSSMVSESAAALKVPSRKGLPNDAKKAINAALKEMRNRGDVSPLVFVLNQIRRTELSDKQVKTLNRLLDFANNMRSRLSGRAERFAENMLRPLGNAIYPVSIPYSGYAYYGHRGGYRGPRGHGPRGGHGHGPRPGGPRPPGPPAPPPPQPAPPKPPQPALRVSVSGKKGG